MKTLLIFFISLLSVAPLIAQNSIETQSIAIEDLITFIANSFPLEAEADDKIKTKQISFIIETSKKNFSAEDRVVLQQAFKFLATRLNKEDAISLFVYSGQNGLLLDRVSVKEIKKIMSVINDVKGSISKKHTDGITMAYQLAQDNFNSDANNSVIMVRNPNVVKAANSEVEITANKASNSKNMAGNALLLTAITLLPELISVIKD